MRIQFDSALEHNVTDYLLTCWGDDGAEASHFSVFPCFCYLAQLNLGQDDGYLQNVCKAISGYTHEEYLISITRRINRKRACRNGRW